MFLIFLHIIILGFFLIGWWIIPIIGSIAIIYIEFWEPRCRRKHIYSILCEKRRDNHYVNRKKRLQACNLYIKQKK